MKKYLILIYIIIAAMAMAPSYTFAATQTFTSTGQCPSATTHASFSLTGAQALLTCKGFTLGVEASCTAQKVSPHACKITCTCTGSLATTPTPTPTPTPKISLPVTAGAALVPYSQKKVNYPSQNSNSSAIANGDVSNLTDAAHLPPCPNDPYALYTTATYLSVSAINNVVSNNTTAFADINNKLPSGTVAAPPDQCVARSLVLCGNPPTPCSGISTPIAAEPIAAVCPDGYVQVGEFDMEPAVVYASPGSTVSSPTEITNFGDYKFYRTQGFSCGASATITGYLQSTCITYQDNSSNQASPFDYYLNYPAGIPFANPNGIGVIQIPNNPPLSIENFYQSSSGCSGLTVSPTVTYKVDSTQSGDFSGKLPISITFSGPGSFILQVPYSHVVCYSPANTYFYFSPRLAPRALICAKLQSQYRQINH